MALYEASIQVTGQATAPYVVAALRGPTTKYAKLVELEVFTLTAPTTSLQLALAYSTTQGVTPASPQMTGISRGSDHTTGSGLLIGGFTTRPVIGATTTYFKRIVLPASLGAGVMRTFDLTNPLMLALGNVAGGDLCIVQTTATASGDLVINASWDEG